MFLRNVDKKNQQSIALYVIENRKQYLLFQVGFRKIISGKTLPFNWDGTDNYFNSKKKEIYNVIYVYYIYVYIYIYIYDSQSNSTP